VAQRQASANQVRETAMIESELAVNKRRTDADREFQIATQQNEIAIAGKSKEQSDAIAEAKAAEALAVSAEEKVTTARAVEIADRDRLTAVLAARKEAEKKSTEVVVAAEAEKKASLDRADAIRTLATADAEANKIKAAGVREMGEAEAAVTTLNNEARNKLGENVINFELARKRLETIPAAIAEAVKPIAAIKDIRILNTGGFGGAGNGDGGLGFGDGLAGQLLKLQAFRPMVDEILRQGGYKPGADPLATLLDNATGAQVNGAPAGPAAVADRDN
jgi:flotillin